MAKRRRSARLIRVRRCLASARRRDLRIAQLRGMVAREFDRRVRLEVGGDLWRGRSTWLAGVNRVDLDLYFDEG